MDREVIKSLLKRVREHFRRLSPVAERRLQRKGQRQRLGREEPEADDSLNSLCSANTTDNSTSDGTSQFRLAGRYIQDTHKETALSRKWSLLYLVLNFALDVQLH